MPHLNTQTPTGGDVTQRRDMQPAFSSNLFEQVLQRENILKAWKQVRANKGPPGIDGMTIDTFSDWAKAGNWKQVMIELRKLMPMLGVHKALNTDIFPRDLFCAG